VNSAAAMDSRFDETSVGLDDGNDGPRLPTAACRIHRPGTAGRRFFVFRKREGQGSRLSTAESMQSSIDVGDRSIVAVVPSRVVPAAPQFTATATVHDVRRDSFTVIHTVISTAPGSRCLATAPSTGLQT